MAGHRKFSTLRGRLTPAQQARSAARGKELQVETLLAALENRDAEMLAIQEGIDDMEAGRVMPLREFDREFRRRNDLPAAE